MPSPQSYVGCSATTSAVLTGNARGSAEFVAQGNSSLALIAIAGSLGGIAAVVATMVIAGMLSAHRAATPP